VRELLRQAAEKGNYRARPDVKQSIEALTVDAETQAYVKDNIHPYPVTDAQVKARYDELVASLGKDEYKPRIITVSDAATAQKVMASLKAGQAFDALARQYSLAPTKAVGGEMPWVSFPVPVSEGHTHGLPVELAQAITNLPVGGLTAQPVQVGNVWAIVKLDAKRPTQVPGFDQAKAGIREQLEALALQKAGADLGASLLKGARVQQ
jgi:parvulin-like peptidyl-prolyl isomerase